MKRINFISILTVFIASLFMGISVSAEVCDYDYDMAKSRWTQGGGYSFVTYTRLDGERKDKHAINPEWITKDTEIHLEYETEGDYEGCPVNLIFQTWTGELVTSKEDKEVSIIPSKFDEKSAVYTYKDFTANWGTDFSTLYSISCADKGTNKLQIVTMTITNLDIPDDEIAVLKGGILLKDGKELDISQYEKTEETVKSENDTKAETIVKEKDSEKETEVTKTSNEDKGTEVEEEESSVNGVAIIIVSVLVIGGIVLVIVLIKKKQSRWH